MFGRHRQLQEIISSVVVRCLALPTSFLIGVMLARLLKPEELGQYSYILTVSVVLATPMIAGWTLFLTREVASAASLHDWGKIRGLLHVTYVLAALQFSISVTGAMLAALTGSTSVKTAVIFATLSAFYPLAANLGAIVRALGWRVLGQVPDALLRPLFFMIFVAAFLAAGNTLQSADALFLQAAAVISVALVACLLLLLKLKYSGIRLWTIPATYRPKAWMFAFGPLVLIAVSTGAITHIPLLMTGSLTTLQETGLYRVAQQAASLVGIGLAGIQAWVMPLLARAQSGDDKVSLHKAIRTAQIASCAFAIPVASVLLCYATEVQVLLFGPEYAASAGPLKILVVNEVVICFFILYHHAVVMSRSSYLAMPGLLICLALNLGLSFWLTPAFGAIGAAVAGSVATLIWLLTTTVLFMLRCKGRTG